MASNPEHAHEQVLAAIALIDSNAAPTTDVDRDGPIAELGAAAAQPTRTGRSFLAWCDWHEAHPRSPEAAAKWLLAHEHHDDEWEESDFGL